MGSLDVLRITVDEERQAVALAQEVIGLSDVDLHPERDRWGVSLGAVHTEIRTERSGEDTFVVALAGEHDLYTVPKVQEALCSVIAAGATTIIVDLTETTFLDSTMLHVLLGARNELEGGQLRLVTSDPNIKRVFEIAGMDRLFDFYSSRRAADEEA